MIDKIYTYKVGSASAKALRQELNAGRIKHRYSNFKGGEDKVVLNWGASSLPEEVMKCKIINTPEAVAIASNKLKFFQEIYKHNSNCSMYRELVSIPNYTTSFNTACEMVEDGDIVVERHKLTGNSGEGIRLVGDTDEGVQQAPLYVKYVPKKQEYRIHVANGQVVDMQRKARRLDVPDEDINWRIRNHANGFIFQRTDLEVPNGVQTQAVLACKAIGLDFGAVDVIYNERQEKAYVLEVNTAPGLEGSTLEGYVERFKNWEFE